MECSYRKNRRIVRGVQKYADSESFVSVLCMLERNSISYKKDDRVAIRKKGFLDVGTVMSLGQGTKL